MSNYKFVVHVLTNTRNGIWYVESQWKSSLHLCDRVLVFVAFVGNFIYLFMDYLTSLSVTHYTDSTDRIINTLEMIRKEAAVA
jgi:hypothetical protein